MAIKIEFRSCLHAVLATLAATTLAAGSAASQETGTFTMTQAGNQIGTETFTRSGEMLSTELEVAGQGRIATTSVLGDEGVVTRIELRILPPGDGDVEPLQSLAAEFRDDSVHVEQPIGTLAASAEAMKGTIPYVNPSPSYLEQIVRRARAVGGSDVTVQVWAPGPAGGRVAEAKVTFNGASATLVLGAVSVEIDTDEQGRLLGAEVAAQGLLIERE